MKVADRLLKEFETIASVLDASPERLLRVVDGDASAVHALMVFRGTMTHVLRSKVAERPILSSWHVLIDYLRMTMASNMVERFGVLHLNTCNMLIRDEVMNEGSIDEAPVYVREVIRRAIDLGSAAIILVHNHPSGDPSPSRADIDITRKIAEAGRRLCISVHDHVIVTANGHTSLRNMGLL